MNKTDKALVQKCREYARKFIKFSSAPFNELVNVAYIMARTKPSHLSIDSAIIWALLRHTKYQDRRKKSAYRTHGNYALTDRRLLNIDQNLSASNPAYLFMLQERQRVLVRAVAKLKPEERQLIYWYFKDNMTYAEIGRELVCSDRWASKMVKDVIKELRFWLEELEE